MYELLGKELLGKDIGIYKNNNNRDKFSKIFVELN